MRKGEKSERERREIKSNVSFRHYLCFSLTFQLESKLKDLQKMKQMKIQDIFYYSRNVSLKMEMGFLQIKFLNCDDICIEIMMNTLDNNFNVLTFGSVGKDKMNRKNC
jgi:hypothetical protein